MSLVHFDEIYEICCDTSTRPDEKIEQVRLDDTGKNIEQPQKKLSSAS